MEKNSGHLLTICFPESRSKNLPYAIAIAKASGLYSEQDVDGRLIYFAGFKKTKEGAIQARALLKFVGAWRGTQVFAGRKPTHSPFNTEEVLLCYLTASELPDHTAHCWTKYPNGRIHPCKIIARGYPASNVDELVAGAIHRGVDWCPFFGVWSFKKIEI